MKTLYITLNHILNSLKGFESILALIKPLLNLYGDIFPGIWDHQDGNGVCSLHIVLWDDHSCYTVQPCKAITGPKDSHELAGNTIIDPPPCVTVGNFGHLLVSFAHKPVQMLESVWKMTYQTILCFPFGSRLWDFATRPRSQEVSEWQHCHKF